jgi:transcriptional regulator with XRE-family HTH domain
MAINVQRERLRAKMSVLELANEVGVTDTAIRDIESGRLKISILRVPALCRALDLDRGEVLREVLAAGPVKLDVSALPEATRERVAEALSMALDALAKAEEDAA